MDQGLSPQEELAKLLEQEKELDAKLEEVNAKEAAKAAEVEQMDKDIMAQKLLEGPGGAQPETPEQPQQPETPAEQPETPDQPQQPETPAEQPETPDQPQQPETPETPAEQPETPEQPQQPETPEQPQQPETPAEQPETPEQPQQPETPEQPEMPGEQPPEQPQQPETPEQPEQPETPEQPEQPETPEQPQQPETPEQPEMPGEQPPEQPQEQPEGPAEPTPEGEPAPPEGPGDGSGPEISQETVIAALGGARQAMVNAKDEMKDIREAEEIFKSAQPMLQSGDLQGAMEVVIKVQEALLDAPSIEPDKPEEEDNTLMMMAAEKGQEVFEMVETKKAQGCDTSHVDYMLTMARDHMANKDYINALNLFGESLGILNTLQPPPPQQQVQKTGPLPQQQPVQQQPAYDPSQTMQQQPQQQVPVRGPPQQQAPPAAPQQQIREFDCPHCGGKFQQYVVVGVNVLNCPKCKGRSQINQGPFEAPAEGAFVLKGSYNNDDEALEDSLNVLVRILGDERCPIKFVNTGEYVFPKATMKKNAYEHMGNRRMNLVLLREAVNDFRIIGNEMGGGMTPRRDELISMKTLGNTFLMMEDWQMLDPVQKQQATRSIYIYVDFISKKC